MKHTPVAFCSYIVHTVVFTLSTVVQALHGLMTLLLLGFKLVKDSLFRAVPLCFAKFELSTSPVAQTDRLGTQMSLPGGLLGCQSLPVAHTDSQLLAKVPWWSMA